MSQSHNLSVFVGGKKVDLNQGTYIAQGGQAVVHQKHGVAYKVYMDDQGNIDPSKMIPAGKIHELAKLTSANILGPKDVIYDSKGKEIGFTMPYVANTEFLPRLFVASFRQSENITPTMMKELVKKFQLAMKGVHSFGKPNDYLIVDANENNLLIAKGYDDVYLIDVDSWKTPTYQANALMDSVRDRTLKTDSAGRVYPDQFTTASDWFSFAVTAAQMYLGCHPYKGIHPSFKRKDWMNMMDKNISVFDPQCKMPPNTQDLSVIPPAHRKWLEGVLQKGDRSEPPQPDSVVAATTTPQVVFGTETFHIDPIRTYDGRVLAARYIQGVCYVQTTVGFYSNDKKLDSLTVSENGIKYDFCQVQGDNLPTRLTYKNAVQELKIVSLDGKLNETVPAENFFVANNKIYTVQNERLVEYTLSKIGTKTILGRQIVGNVFHNNIVGDGVVTQNILGKTWFTFPQHAATSISVGIKELDAYKIVQTRRVNNVVVGIASDKNNRKDRFVLVFDKGFKSYNIRFEEDTDSLDANFVVLDKGVTVAVNGDKAELFFDNSQVKVVDKFPLTKGQQLFSFGNDVYFTHEKGLYKIALKP